jgi:hypothetical protein
MLGSIASTPPRSLSNAVALISFSSFDHRTVKRRPWCQLVELSTAEDGLIQISDFEMIEWDPVLEGRQRASSYIIRKGSKIFSSLITIPL